MRRATSTMIHNIIPSGRQLMNKQHFFQWIWFFSFVIALAKCNDDVNFCTKLEAADGTQYNLETLIEKGPFTLPVADEPRTSNVTVSLCSNSVQCKTSANLTSVSVCSCERIQQNGQCSEIIAYGVYTPSGVKPLNDGAGVEFDFYWQGKSILFKSKYVIITSNSDRDLLTYKSIPNFNSANAAFDESGFLIEIVIRTEAACPVKSTISGGTVFMLIVLGVVVLYVVIGILVNKFSLMKQGREVMPHVEFWTDLPILVKDGAVFVVQKVRNRSNPYEPVVEYN